MEILNNNNLKERVMRCRSKLTEIGVKSARYYFSLKYPEYTKDKLDNLWYCKIEDKNFTKKLESFTTYKEVEFN